VRVAEEEGVSVATRIDRKTESLPLERTSRERVKAGERTYSGVPYRRRKGDGDLLVQYHRPIAYLRWTVLFLDIGVGSFYQGFRFHVFAAAVLVAWNVFRTIEPLRLREHALATAVWLVIDIAVPVVVVVQSGGWDSPFLLSLIPPLITSALTQGRMLSSGLGLLTGVIIMSSMSINDTLNPVVVERGVRWTGVLMVLTLATGLAYRMMKDASTEEVQATEQMIRLSEANALLYDLQRVARRLPSSLDIGEVLRSTTAAFAELSGMSCVAVLIFDTDSGRWTVAQALGASMPLIVEAQDLPVAARTAVAARIVIIENQSIPMLASGGSTVAVFVPLVARDRLVGLIIGEEPFTAERSPDLGSRAAQFAEQAAVTIDNARWFGRIRSAAADDERVRIARDLHDRVGQSLALIGFELDRICRTEAAEHLRDDLALLRRQVRTAVTEVRETLYDLRTDVRLDGSMAATLSEFLERVGERSNLVVHLETTEPVALPVRLARELWHIAQEAIINVERHAQATDLWVEWQCDGSSAFLSVRDNGTGFGASSGRQDSYGLRGLRERAAGIGAVIEIDSVHGQGTTVLTRLQDENLSA
jgi:signal transduction histidine kinase